MKIISGSSNYNLAARISKILDIEMLHTKINHFGDGELNVRIDGNIGKEIMIVQSTSTPVNDHLMELLLLIDAVKRAGAENITAIIPYFGYSRQDRSKYKHEPISSSLVIKLIEAAGVTKVITLDLHSSQVEGMFRVPVINLLSSSIFFPALEGKRDVMVVSPDIGGVARARNYSSLLGSKLAIIDKVRDVNNVCSMGGIIGDVRGKECVIVDDIIDGASTICMATELLLKNGAKTVEAIVTHPVFSGDATSKIEKSGIQKIYISDSIFHDKLPEKFIIMPIAELIANVV